jgi:hypothetical protein
MILLRGAPMAGRKGRVSWGDQRLQCDLAHEQKRGDGGNQTNSQQKEA